MQTRPLRTRSLLPEDRDAELAAAHRRAQAAMAEVNRMARRNRIRAGLEQAPAQVSADALLVGAAGVAAGVFAYWWWKSGKQAAVRGFPSTMRGLDCLMAA